MALLTRIFLENLSDSRLGFRWAVKISWWRIRRAPRLFATHWAGLMISAWPGFVSELRAHCLLLSRPRWAADGPAAAQSLLSPAPFVLHRCSARSPEHVPLLQLSGNASAPLPLPLRPGTGEPAVIQRDGESCYQVSMSKRKEGDVETLKRAGERVTVSIKTHRWEGRLIICHCKQVWTRSVHRIHKGWHKSHITVNKHAFFTHTVA